MSSPAYRRAATSPTGGPVVFCQLATLQLQPKGALPLAKAVPPRKMSSAPCVNLAELKLRTAKKTM